MDDKEYYARLRKEMEKKKADSTAKSAKKSTHHKAKVLVGKSVDKPATEATPITNDDILNIRIAAENSDDVLDFIRSI